MCLRRILHAMDRREEILQSLQRAGSRRVQDIIAGQRFRIGGHILRVPENRRAKIAMTWVPTEDRMMVVEVVAVVVVMLY